MNEDGVVPEPWDELAPIRRQAIRRARFAANFHALKGGQVPPEGVFDAALTNGLAAIVAHDWPGEDLNARGRVHSAPKLLGIIEEKQTLGYFQHDLLLDAVLLTAALRHGAVDDDFADITVHHIGAVEILDQHPALQFLKGTEGLTIMQAVDASARSLGLDALPIRPKDRLGVPGAEWCEECGKETFLPDGWDMYGGTTTAGVCKWCGYERTEAGADEQADMEHLARMMERDD
jgi:hypothetical protein